MDARSRTSLDLFHTGMTYQPATISEHEARMGTLTPSRLKQLALELFDDFLRPHLRNREEVYELKVKLKIMSPEVFARAVADGRPIFIRGNRCHMFSETSGWTTEIH